MTGSMSSRRQAQAAALLILVGLLALITMVIVGPLVSGFYERAAQRKQLAVQYNINNRNIAAIPRLHRLAKEHERLLGDFVTTAPDSASAGEALRQRLQTAIITMGGDFRGGEDIPAPARQAAIRVTARIPSNQLNLLLANIQNTKPFLTITALVVGADEALITGQASALDVQIEASIPYRVAAKRQ
jgi:hypothetical protein